MNGLTQQQMSQLSNTLLEEKTALQKHIEENGHFGLTESHRDSIGELSSNDNHPADVATEIYERGKDIALNEHAEHHLEDVNRSLESISIGHYGLCIICDKSIPFERLEAIPTTEFCKQHAPVDQVEDSRPIEEEFLSPPFGRTSLDEQADQNQFDGEDAWQIVESWGTSNSPAMAEDSEIHDYNSMYIESDEPDGYVEPLESFLATDIYGNPIPIIRNREYRKYMASNEGDHGLEIEQPDDAED